MISKRIQKLIRSLELKKNRKAEGLFLAEGPKIVGDLLSADFHPRVLLAVNHAYDYWRGIVDNDSDIVSNGCELISVTEEELQRLSLLQHPQEVLAVFEMPKEGEVTDFAPNSLSLALDSVQDPGNLGTIIRIADWFGIKTIYCSTDTADAYNPKVVQATMGSIARVNVVYTSLPALLDSLPQEIPVYGTLLDGENLYEQELSPRGIIVMGNEGKGISPMVRQRVNQKILIPPYPNDEKTAESLNVATATAIICAEFRRRMK